MSNQDSPRFFDGFFCFLEHHPDLAKLKLFKRFGSVHTVLRLLSGVVVIWLFLPRTGSTANIVHRAFCNDVWSHASRWDKVKNVADMLIWLSALPVVVSVMTWRCGKQVKREAGVSITSQILTQLKLAFRFAVPSPWYYMFEFHRLDNRRRAAEYLYVFELKHNIYHRLRRRWTSQATLNTLSDKALFSQECERHGLAVIPTLATADHGRVNIFHGAGVLPARDLFFKPRRGAGGRGASRWYYFDSGEYRASSGVTCHEAVLREKLCENSCRRAYIVRPLVTNHEALKPINCGSLSTVRVMTCLDETGAIVITHTILRMARSPYASVDNFHQGGIAAPIDLKTGRVGQATDNGCNPDSQWHRVHPETGAAIEGLQLPFWPQVLELARQAHAVFSDLILAGWDIAILANGPCLVEGNKGPDLDVIQRLHRAPAGNGQIGRTLAFYLPQEIKRCL